MSDSCTVCGSSLIELDADAVGRMLNSVGMWNWSYRSVGYKELVDGLGEVEVVYNSYDLNEIGTMLFVWKTRVGHISITGTYDSYSDLEWNNDFKFVTPETKQITVYN